MTLEANMKRMLVFETGRDLEPTTTRPVYRVTANGSWLQGLTASARDFRVEVCTQLDHLGDRCWMDTHDSERKAELLPFVLVELERRQNKAEAIESAVETTSGINIGLAKTTENLLAIFDHAAVLGQAVALATEGSGHDREVGDRYNEVIDGAYKLIGKTRPVT